MSGARRFVFAPGAGAPSASVWMQAWRRRLTALGDVVTFDYPYMKAGRRVPDRQPALIAAHEAALAAARADFCGPVFLIGKSMGSRIGCHVSLQSQASGIVCLGYPLVSGATGALRDEVLLALRTPILFVQGTSDPLCPLEKLQVIRERMGVRNELHVVTGGNHSLEVSRAKAQRPAQEASDQAVIAAIRAFVESVS